MTMKKLATIASATALASLLAVNILAAPAVAGRKTCEAYIADVTVDGKIDDVWNYAPVIPVDIVKENASAWFGDTSKVAGKDYAVVNSKVLWNGNNTLYILFEVEDNVISTVGANPWDQDSVEYFIKLDNANTGDKTQNRLFSDNKGGDLAAEVYGYARTTKGCIIEVAVDISAVGGAGEYFGIDFQYNDDAEGKGVRNVCLGWSDAIDKASSDPSVYGQCLLSDKKVADIIAEEKAKAEAEASAKTADPAALALLAACGGGYC
ncbi:MAG: hypothetical protein HFE63_00775 [Clostridiales bacterium]|nr:hypothetical protein [Clostridiales bacterium]